MTIIDSNNSKNMKKLTNTNSHFFFQFGQPVSVRRPLPMHASFSYLQENGVPGTLQQGVS